MVGRTGRFGTYHPWLKLRDDASAVPVPFATLDCEEDDDLDFADGWIPQPIEQTAMARDPWAPSAQTPWGVAR